MATKWGCSFSRPWVLKHGAKWAATISTSQIAKKKNQYKTRNGACAAEDKDFLPLPKHEEVNFAMWPASSKREALRARRSWGTYRGAFLPRAPLEALSPAGRECQQECCSWCWAAAWQRIRALLAGRPASGPCGALQLKANASPACSEPGSPAASVLSRLPNTLETGPWWGWVRQQWVCRW